MPTRRKLRHAAATAVIAIGVTAGLAPVSSAAPRDTYDPKIEPSDFVATVDNPYFPLTPGARWVYEGTTNEGSERVEIEVTDQTKEILGVTTVVVHDLAFIDGELVEDTVDWFAQDRQGNVWYMGEDTHEIKDGKPVSSRGSWEAGVDGAKPGIAMKAKPRVGETYRQEYYKGTAEDMATVLGVHASGSVPYGAFDDAVKTKDFSPLEPKLVEHKFYARDVGFVLEKTLKGGTGRIGLIEYTNPSGE